MPHRQNAQLESYRATDSSPCHSLNGFDVASAVTRGELVLSLSTMLGCDYIFVSHRGTHELLHPKRADKTIRELLDLLDTSPHQSMVIGADEAPDGQLHFTRYDYVWENRQVTKTSVTPVTHSDQIDFMQMMVDCSAAC